MKHISILLLEITEQQLFLQSRQNELEARIESLASSSDLNAIAWLPKLEAEFNELHTLHGRISHRIQSVSHPG